MTWACERCRNEFGHKDYTTERDAQRYAATFDRRESDNMGRGAPLIGLFPLRIWHKFRAARLNNREARPVRAR